MSDLEGWKRALLTLPGDRFLLLVRNYLGEIRTPYNKQELIRQLAAFLSDRGIQEKILAFVDPREAAVITALELLGAASLESLAALFQGRIGLLALGEMLANMEERLLVYRGHDEARLVAVNPILDPVFRARVHDTGRLFPWSAAAPPGRAPVLWVSDVALLAIVSQLCSGAIVFKKDGGLRKRDLSALASIFPAHASRAGEDDAGDSLARAVATLLRLLEEHGLLAEDGRPRVAAWRSLAARARRGRAVALLAPLLGKDVRRDLAAHHVAGLLAALEGPGDVARAFEPAGLHAVCVMLALRVAPETAASVPSLISRLRELNVLIEAGDRLMLHPDIARDQPAAPAVVQPNFEVTFPGEVLLADGLEVALSAEVRRVDAAAVFDITRASFQRYLDLGGSAERLVDALERLEKPRGAAALPQNVLFSLRTWEREYRRLALYDGVVLVADEEHQYLLDNSPALRRHMRKKIAPGVYLLAAADRDAWVAALRRAGVDHVPEIVSVRPEGEDEGPAVELPFEEPLLGADLSVDVGSGRSAPWDDELLTKGTRAAGPAAAAAKTALLAELEALGLEDDEAAEIRDRIERGLILVPRQLRPLATEKAEARGLDYLGKVRLIERAIERGALVEMLERGASGAPHKILARPEKLEKSAAGLILAAEALPDGHRVKVAVSRLSRVRLVMRSLLD